MNQKLHQVLAPITGTIWKITTQVGQAVEETDTILIMESMKMEMPVEPGATGTVHAFHVKEGQPVNEGQLLAEIKI